jgi:hypothetical protein
MPQRPTLNDLYPIAGRTPTPQAPVTAARGNKTLEELYPTRSASGAFDLANLDELEKEFGLKKPAEVAYKPLPLSHPLDLITTAPKFITDPVGRAAASIADPNSRIGKAIDLIGTLVDPTNSAGRVVSHFTGATAPASPRAIAGSFGEGLAAQASPANAVLMATGLGAPALAARGMTGAANVARGVNVVGGVGLGAPMIYEGGKKIIDNPLDKAGWIEAGTGALSAYFGGRDIKYLGKGAPEGSVAELSDYLSGRFGRKGGPALDAIDLPTGPAIKEGPLGGDIGVPEWKPKPPVAPTDYSTWTGASRRPAPVEPFVGSDRRAGPPFGGVRSGLEPTPTPPKGFGLGSDARGMNAPLREGLPEVVGTPPRGFGLGSDARGMNQPLREPLTLEELLNGPINPEPMTGRNSLGIEPDLSPAPGGYPRFPRGGIAEAQVALEAGQPVDSELARFFGLTPERPIGTGLSDVSQMDLGRKPQMGSPLPDVSRPAQGQNTFGWRGPAFTESSAVSAQVPRPRVPTAPEVLAEARAGQTQTPTGVEPGWPGGIAEAQAGMEAGRPANAELRRFFGLDEPPTAPAAVAPAGPRPVPPPAPAVPQMTAAELARRLNEGDPSVVITARTIEQMPLDQQRELRLMVEEMDNFGFQKGEASPDLVGQAGTVDQGASSSAFVPNPQHPNLLNTVAGAPVFHDIQGGIVGSRRDVQGSLERFLGGGADTRLTNRAQIVAQRRLLGQAGRSLPPDVPDVPFQPAPGRAADLEGLLGPRAEPRLPPAPASVGPKLTAAELADQLAARVAKNGAWGMRPNAPVAPVYDAILGGEQGRLPGAVGAVRDMEVAQPRVADLPEQGFNLTAPAETQASQGSRLLDPADARTDFARRGQIEIPGTPEGARPAPLPEVGGMGRIDLPEQPPVHPKVQELWDFLSAEKAKKDLALADNPLHEAGPYAETPAELEARIRNEPNPKSLWSKERKIRKLFDEGGFAETNLLGHIAGSATGALAGGAADKEHPWRGAALGALGGLATVQAGSRLAPAIARGLREFPAVGPEVPPSRVLQSVMDADALGAAELRPKAYSPAKGTYTGPDIPRTGKFNRADYPNLASEAEVASDVARLTKQGSARPSDLHITGTPDLAFGGSDSGFVDPGALKAGTPEVLRKASSWLERVSYGAMLSGAGTAFKGHVGPVSAGISRALEEAWAGRPGVGGKILKNMAFDPEARAAYKNALFTGSADPNATRWGQTQGLAGVPSRIMAAPDAWVTKAMTNAGIPLESAQRSAFTGGTRSASANAIKEGQKKLPGFVRGLAAPFVNTALNLTERGIERTPGLGLLFELAQKTGGREVSAGRDILARQGLGLAALGAAYGLAPDSGEQMSPYAMAALGPYAVPTAIGTALKGAMHRRPTLGGTLDPSSRALKELVQAGLSQWPLPTEGYELDRQLDPRMWPSRLIPRAISQFSDAGSYAQPGWLDPTIARIPWLNDYLLTERKPTRPRR